MKNASKIVLNELNKKGFEAFLIGGSVRDAIMNRKSGDIDITTNALPQEIKKVFENYRVVETGIKHGTVTVIVEGESVEVTTYRCEGKYSDNRHPDFVSFSKNLRDDVVRRDFTINGIAMDSDGKIYDFVGGVADIDSKIIRTIGNATDRFNEDALRILRGLRFASTLGFTVEKDTKNAVFECRELLKNISAERINEELCKLIMGDFASEILLEYGEVFSVIIPEILKTINYDQKNRHHVYDVYTHTAKALKFSNKDLVVRLALLFHDLGKPQTATMDEKGERHFKGHQKVSAEIANEIMTRLRFKNEMKNSVVKLVELHDVPFTEEKSNAVSQKRLRKILSEIGEDLTYKLIEIKRCDNLSQNLEYYRGDDFYIDAKNMVKKIVAENQCVKIKDLKINGEDLIEMGFEGKKIGEILDFLLKNVMEEKVPNEKELLINLVEKTYI